MLRSFALAALGSGRRLASLELAAPGAGVGAALRSASSSAPPPPPPPPPPPTTSADEAATPPPPDAGDPVAALLRRLGTARSCTRRSISDSVGLFDLFSAAVRSARAGLAVHLTTRAVETDFSAPEFLEGATAAYHAVHAAVTGQAWGELRGMVSPALADAAQGLVAAAAAEGLAVSLDVEPSVRAEIDTMTLISAELAGAMAADGWQAAAEARRGGRGGAAAERGGEEEAEAEKHEDASPPPPPPSPFNPNIAGRHQAMHVRFFGGAVTLRLAAAHGAAAAAAAAGLAQPPPPADGAVLEVTDRRARVWVFERGPLPPGLPVRDTQLPWRVLAIEP